MSNLRCSGSEWSVGECSWSAPGGACEGHTHDTVVYCTSLAEGGTPPEGAVRLLASDGSPSVDGKGRPEILSMKTWVPICSGGASAGAASVICKSMGFSAASGSSKCSGDGCGRNPPGIGELVCSGAESSPLACTHKVGDDVFCAASESVVVNCVGDGETQGRPSKEAVPQLAF